MTFDQSLAAMSAYLAMGGDGEFIWPAYGVAALVLAVIAIASVRNLRRSEAALAALERETGARRTRR